MGTKKNIIQMGKKGRVQRFMCMVLWLWCELSIEVGEEAAVPSPSHGVNGRTSPDESSQRQGYE